MDLPTAASLAGLASVADRQHGLFTAKQAKAVGLSKAFLDNRYRLGELIATDHNVYRCVLTPTSWHQQVLATCLVGPAVASHRCAAALWTVPDLLRDLVEVTAWRHRRRKSPDVIWHESYLLDEQQVTEIDGIPVTNATRTLLDLAAVVDDDLLLRCLDDFLRRRLTSPERLGTWLDRLGPRRPGARRMRAVMSRRFDEQGRARMAVPESDLEPMFENLIRRSGLPVPTPQYPVKTPDGRTLRIDYAYGEETVGIELMGARFHSPAERWHADVERLACLAEMDWHMLTFTYDDVRLRPERTVRSVRHALVRAGHRLETLMPPPARLASGASSDGA